MVTLREEHRPRMLQNCVLRRVFVTKGGREGMIRDNSSFTVVSFATSNIRIIRRSRGRWTVHVARMDV